MMMNQAGEWKFAFSYANAAWSPNSKYSFHC